jgi:hypothetical protein
MNPGNLTIVADEPLWIDSQDTWTLSAQVHQYQQTIEAVGGYWSAQFTIRGNRHLIDDWLQDGLGRHVEVFDHSLTEIWEGFVDKVTANYGSLAVVRGPLLDVANRVGATYSSITYDEDNKPIVGTRTVTQNVNDTDSQALWGIIPKMLSVGGVSQTDVAAIRNTYLEAHRLPATDKSWRTDAHSETSITVDCLGYVHWLNWPYNNGITGEDDADVKILDVLGDTPNVAWLVFGTDHVDENVLQVPMWEDEGNLAWSVIKDTVARGGTSNERWLFGVYANREVFYNAAPTVVEYQQRLSQSRPMVEGAESGEVYPWNVLPGKWIMFPDFLIGQAAELDLKDDPRAMFIERVTYRAPMSLELGGGTVDTLDSIVAQLGLSGVGA